MSFVFQNIRPNPAFTGAALLSTLLAAALPAQGEDIDLFRYNQANEDAVPNVLFLIDNTANWNSTLNDTTKRSLEHDALAGLFADRSATLADGSPNPNYLENRMRVGFMLYSDAQPEGGKVVDAMEMITDTYRQELREKFLAGVDDTDAGLPKSNNASLALSMYEAYQYFGGREVRAGEPSNKKNEIQPDPDAFASEGIYRSPGDLDGDACTNYLVLISNGQPDSGENRGGTPENLLEEIGGNANTITGLEPSDYESIVADEYARFFSATDVIPDSLQAGDQRLATYVIDVFDPDSNKEKTRKARAGHALLKSVANQTGPGAYFAVHNAEQLREAIRDLVTDLLSQSSVFAAVALPVSVNVRGTNLNQVYIGVFRPDANDNTRWFGNLKLYQLNRDPDTDDVFLADVDGHPAQSPQTGFFANEATSFWTHASTYWSFSPRGEPPSASDAPDGPVVEKGGVAQRLRELGDDDYANLRNVYTCTEGCSTGDSLANTPFVDANVPLSTDLIDWVRGEDNYVTTDSSGNTVAADEDDDGDTDDARASVHGDVLHSQPAIVNYGNGDVMVFYGSNDGMIHAVRGGTDPDAGGAELWSFVPPEFFDELYKLRSNTSGKTYFADGNLTAYVIDANGDHIVDSADGDRVLLYATMRRGGRFMYAFDVTEPTDPVFLWKIDNDKAGFAELGQTWSDIAVGQLEGRTDPVAIFAAGYDPAAEDPDGIPGSDDSDSATQGRGLFVVDALTGELIWQAGPSPDTSGTGATLTISDMQYSMPAGPTPIDRDSDGDLDRIYVPDTGGQVWRVDLGDDNSDTGSGPSTWTAYKLGDVGADQEFQYPVDVVAAEPTRTYSDRFDAVLVGSGDRENPFDTSVENRFYMFKDSPTPGAPDYAPIAKSDLYDATDNAVQVGTESERQAAIDGFSNSRGWYITLGGAGEKVVGGATTLAGTTFFGTNTPPDGTEVCGSGLGEARNYAVSYRDASATIEQDGQPDLTTPDRANVVEGGGFPPSPVPFVVDIDGKQKLGVLQGLNDQEAPNVPLGVRQRVYWYREDLDD